MANVFQQRVDIVFELRRDGEDRCLESDGAVEVRANLLELILGRDVLYKVNLVLKNDYITQFHNLYSLQVLQGLGLREGFVGGDQQKGSIHNSGTVEHGRHQHVVAGAVHKRHVAHQLHCFSALLAGRRVALGASERLVAARRGALAALEDLRVCVPEVDGDVHDGLLAEPRRAHAAHRLHNRRLSVGHVADGANVNRRLS
mmetsp:Transcript_40938/g.47600  ORF Transcript_40938/g.47600 Transcript_40938/m.47600 type:complete len:201 (+) Transcript_40938:928-1530(+)